MPARSSQCAGRKLEQVVAATNPSALAGTKEPPDPPVDSGGGMACMPRPSDLYQARTVVGAIVEAYDVEVFLEVPEILESIDKFVKDRLTGQLLAMHLSLFDSMNQASIALFTSALTVQSYHEGDVVFEKDSHGIDFYVLVQGAVSIDDGEDVHVTLDHKGAYFGEVALLRAEPRAATITARGNTTIACIPGETFRTLCLTSASVAAEFEIKALGAKASIGALLTHLAANDALAKSAAPS